MRIAKRLHIPVIIALLAAFIYPVTFSEPAHAAPACTPVYGTPDQTYGLVRNFVFSSVGTCTWTVPSNMYVERILIVGGGGGGGGGSWAGSTSGGAGGGGGAGGLTFVTTLPYIYGGSTVDITIGGGGTAGTGAAASSNLGSAGGDGATSKFGTWEADGGLGGGGGGSDLGGTGGTSGKSTTGVAQVGGNPSSGNGGAGGSSISGSPASNATSSSGAPSYGGAPVMNTTFINPVGGYFGASGGGGASGSNSAAQGGTASQAPATVPANTGAGGHGGHGCVQSAGTCANRNGSAGSAGRVIVAVKWASTPTKAFNAPNPTFYVGQPVIYAPINTPPAIGTGTWSVLDLPPGLTLNTSTGVISGTPTSFVATWTIILKFVDSAFPSMSVTGQSIVRVLRGNQSLEIPRQSLEVTKTFRIPIEQLKGTGVTTLLATPSNKCSTTGIETVTALANSGTCTITVTKYQDSDYNYGSFNFYIDLKKIQPTLTLSTSVPSIEEGRPVTLTANVSSGATGYVKFYFQNTLLTQCGSGTGSVALSNGQATCVWTPTSGDGNVRQLYADYLGSTNYEIVEGNDVPFTVYPSISLKYSGSTSTFGSSATVNPTVSGGSGAPSTWNWSIKKTSDNSSVSGISINSSGVISVSSSLAASTYNMTVTAVDSASVTASAPVNIYVAPSTPTVVLNQPSKVELTKGQSVSLSATLPSNASGTVTFKYGATSITSCGSSGLVTISAGSASCVWNTSTVTPGAYDITAYYSGGGSYTASTSNPLNILINAKASFAYDDYSIDYGSGGIFFPSIVDNTGSGNSDDWTWSIVKTSDSSTVSDFIMGSGVFLVSSTIGAGTYPMTITAVDTAGDTMTATTTLIVNKITPTITLSPRLITNAIAPEATVNRQISWKIESTHRSAGAVAVYVNGSNINCTTSIQWGDGQCWWSSSSSGTTVSAYATFAGDSNLETATSNLITGFNINPALSLSYSDTSTYSGIDTSLTPTVSGGTGARYYGIMQYPLGNDVLGITIDSTTGVITVSKSAAPGVYRMQALVYDATSANASDDNVQITVLAQQQPSIALSSTSENVNKNSYLSGYSIINSSTPGFTFSISPSLPAGLYFSTSTGEIYGAPTAAQSATTYTITATNGAGSATATFSITVSENLVATISLALGTNPAAKGVANTIIATISAAGKVQFYAQGKRIPGCISLSGTSSVTCNWKPTLMGIQSLTARLFPNNSALANVSSAPLTVGVGRRTGRR